ncbi:nicotinate-nucleotide adenylyltransferase [bacterium]|nr:nicotinate-nucleotide adenylyltransferase [bacterium]
MKKCIFGGTFDPPHIGHLLIAQTICEAEEFDKIIFVPALKNPHKSVGITSPIDKRLKMLEIAVEGNPHFEISDIEIKRGGISYSLDTIRHIKKEQNLKCEELYFLIGSDILNDFHKWHEPLKILEECQVIVALRPGFQPSSIPNWILSEIQFANIPRFELSATQIRKRWRENKTIRYMVTQPVWEFINENSLYS